MTDHKEYLRGGFETYGGPTPQQERTQGRSPYASWTGAARSGYLWVGTDQTCFFTMSRAAALRLAHFILDSADELHKSRGPR